MNKIIFSLPVVLIVCLLSFSEIGLTSCSKETQLVHDTVIVIKKDTLIQRDTVIYKDTVSITLQPCENPNETEISTFWTGNNTTLQELPAYYWTNNGTPVEGRSLLKFNLADIPANRTIINAKLSLYAVPNPINGNQTEAHSGSNNAVLIQRITASWSTTTLSWNNQPTSTTTNQIELAATSDHFKNYIDLDATNLIKDMFTNGNHGMIIKLKALTLYNIQNFASSKHDNEALRPKLVVTYTKP